MSTRAAAKRKMPGETVPALVPFALILLGLACALWAAQLFVTTRAATAETPPPAEPAVVASVIPAPAPVACVPLFDVYFAHGSDAVDAGALGEYLPALVRWLGAHPEARLVASGHADASGDEYYNVVISHRRAERVRAVLAEAGVDPGRVRVRAHGEYGSGAVDAAGDEALRRCVTLNVPGYPDCRAKEER